jgi:hypothetical protein
MEVVRCLDQLNKFNLTPQIGNSTVTADTTIGMRKRSQYHLLEEHREIFLVVVENGKTFPLTTKKKKNGRRGCLTYGRAGTGGE